MAKQSHSPAAAMPKGQMFRQSVKRRKDDGTSNSDNTSRLQKEEGNPIKKMKNSEGSAKAPQKSILKKITAPQSGNNKGKEKETESEILQSKVSKQNSLTGKATKNELKEKKINPAQSKKAVKVTKPVKEVPLPKTFRIIAGSYERLLYGFQVKIEAHGEVKAEPSFTPMFSFAAHTSCISAVAAAGIDSKWLATGAGDETVRVWDLRKKKEVGGLTGHGGTIHSLSFPSRTYLISSDSSGLINLYRTRDWALLKTLRGHTGRVNACQAHPSGKVALSVGQDGMLRMWDLMRGKGAGAVKLRLGMTEEGQEVPSRNVKEEPLDVQWSPDGSRFLVMGRTEVSVFSTDMIKIASVIVRRDDPKHKFGSAFWLNDQYVLCGTESGTVDIYHVGKDSLVGPLCQLVGHENRVKSIRSIRLHPSASTNPIDLVVTASSDGKIRIYDCSDLITLKSVKEKKTEEIEKREPIATHDTGGARLTCLDVVGGSGVRTGATDSKETDAEDESDEEDGDDDDEAGFDLSDEDDDPRGTKAGEEMNESELQELNDLLDLLEEAKTQGLDVEGLSDFEGDEEDLYDDDDDDEEEDEEEEEEEEEEDE